MFYESYRMFSYRSFQQRIIYLSRWSPLWIKKKKEHKKISINFDTEKEIVKERKKYIPPMSHTFKAASFKRQMEKAHTKHIYA